MRNDAGLDNLIRDGARGGIGEVTFAGLRQPQPELRDERPCIPKMWLVVRDE
jgi:hypothetical protein